MHGHVNVKFAKRNIKTKVIKILKLLKLFCFGGGGVNSTRILDFHGKAFEPNSVEK
jgi:hypothetical protein